LWSIPGETREEFDPFTELDVRFFELLKIPGASEFSSDDRFTIAADIYARQFVT
jgi:hypothetical protein